MKPHTRDMHYGWRFWDPLDVWNWLDETNMPFRLVKARRHPQGYHTSLWDVTWDCKVHLCALRAVRWTYAYNTSNTFFKSRYHMNSAINSTAMKLIRTVLPESPKGYAQSVILQDTLWSYICSGEFNPQIYGGGSSIRGYSASYDSTRIKVTIDDFTSVFKTQDVINLISKQFKPQQLTLF